MWQKYDDPSGRWDISCVMREISAWQLMRDQGKGCAQWMEVLDGIEDWWLEGITGSEGKNQSLRSKSGAAVLLPLYHKHCLSYPCVMPGKTHG